MRKRAPIPKKIRDEIKAKYDGHCGYCGGKPEKLQIDHIMPLNRTNYLAKRGIGINDTSNLMPACAKCNNYKLTYSLEEFRQMLQRQIELCRQNSVNFRNAERFGMVQILKTSVVFYFEEIENESKVQEVKS